MLHPLPKRSTLSSIGRIWPLFARVNAYHHWKPKASPGCGECPAQKSKEFHACCARMGLKKTMSRLCEPCLLRHGAAQECPATQEAEDGSPICVFCLDGEPCLHDRKVIASQKRLSANQTMEEKHMLQQGHEPGDQVTAVAPTATKKICRVPGCGRQLYRDNQSGFCSSHVPRSKKPTSRATGNGANGHASKSGKNGKRSPGPIPQKIDRDQLVEQRINTVMLAWSAAEKMRVVEAWLAGAI
jgi:hypothetical protein